MTITPDMLDKLVPITLFDRGHANKIFNRLKSEARLVVIKNNIPEAVILSVNEFRRIYEIVEDYRLLMLAQERLANYDPATAISHESVMLKAGITQADLDAIGDVEIE